MMIMLGVSDGDYDDDNYDHDDDGGSDGDVDDDGGNGDNDDDEGGDYDGGDGEGGDDDGDDGEQQGGEKEEQLGVEATTCLMGTFLASILLAISPQPSSTSTS